MLATGPWAIPRTHSNTLHPPSSSRSTSTGAWANAINNPGICRGRVTGRELTGEPQYNISQRAMDEADLYARTLEEVSKTTEDPLMASFLATRHVCEANGNLFDYTGPSAFARSMGATASVCLQ